uniref:C2H2-type domain-containing protein n=1 Tax=Angiostrongylus cantonensis TaxID=6313 RepID=A0A0K0DQZ5_ANGCA
MAIVRHVAAHIRHDETRLLNRTGASSVVACDCGMAVSSAMGYIYHIVHDHVFEQKQFSDISATIIIETAIESVLALRVDFRVTKWPLWCAYFSLENDDGDENFFADSTDLNEHWLKLWEDLIEEHITGKSMSLGDTIKLFEMHPFVDEQRLQSRKHKSVSLMDSKTLYRSLSMVWQRLDNWAYDPVHRTQLASESRWIRLAQIRRKVFLEAKKDENQNPDIWSSLTTGAK